MKDIVKLGRIQIIAIVLFIIGKKFLRPFVLEKGNSELLDTIVLSLPNFFEGVIGVLTITMLSLYLRRRLNKKWKYQQIYVIAFVTSAIYTISQELKIHNLGGNNVYDPYDVLFTIFGLLLGYFLLLINRPELD